MLLAPIAAWAQEFQCAALKPSSKREPPYGRAKDGPYCEGYFEQDISAAYLEVVSFVRSGGKAAGSNQPLSLHAASVASRLVVHPLVQGIPFRADIANKEGGTHWMPKPMLDATGLRLVDLGFLALVSPAAGQPLTLIPISIGGPSTGPSIALIRTSVATREVSWRLVPEGSPASESTGWQKAPRGEVERWGLVDIEVRPPSGQSGPFVMHVRARRDDGSLLPVLLFRIAAL